MKSGISAFLLMGTVSVHGSEHLSDIAYESPGSTRATLDVHWPDGGILPGTPTLLYIHGGGWYGGDKAAEDSVPIFQPVAEAGYGVVSCNYTLSVDMSPSYPQAAHDVKAVIRWIRIHGWQYDLSPTVIVTGPSAGGHLSELLGTSDGVEVLEPLSAPPGGYRINGSIPFWGLGDFVQQVQDWGNTGPFVWFLGGPLGDDTMAVYVEASPLTWVSQDDPPMHLIHGYGDPIHDWNSSRVLHEANEAVGVTSSTEFFQGGHSFPDYGGFDAAAARLVELIPQLLALDRTADLDRDGVVGVVDLLAMLQDWGSCPDLPVDCPADIDGSGYVSTDDLLTLLAAWS
jgi:acetyl esterase/lipase